MFSDLKIAESYRQVEAKTKYVLQSGVVPYFNKSLLKDFKDQPFTFKSDESTASQINMMHMYNFGPLYPDKL